MNKNYIDIHTHQKNKSSNVTIVRNAYLTLYEQSVSQLNYLVSVGLHPWHISKTSLNACVDKLINLATLKNVFAIGEIGIDRAIAIDIKTQTAYFEAQLNIARAVKKPVIIHAVRSYSDILPFLKKSTIPFVFHQFQGNAQQAKELVKHGAFLSFGKNLFEEKSALAFQSIPSEHIFLETDTASQITIESVYHKAAQLKDLDMDVLKSIVFHNFANLTKSLQPKANS